MLNQLYKSALASFGMGVLAMGMSGQGGEVVPVDIVKEAGGLWEGLSRQGNIVGYLYGWLWSYYLPVYVYSYVLASRYIVFRDIVDWIDQ